MEVNEKNSLFMANNLEESKKLMNKIIEKNIHYRKLTILHLKFAVRF